MILRLVTAWVFLGGILAIGPAVSAEVERSVLFELVDGDVLEDSGVITVSSKASTRTEVFETVRHGDGGWTTTSIITDLNRPYRVEGRWSYDSNGRSIKAKGVGAYEGVPIKVAIDVQRPAATIHIEVGDETRTVPAQCGPTCFVDLSPSVMAMFSITRQFEITTQETRTYQWIGQALHADFTLLEGGGSDVSLHAVQQLADLEVLQFIFLETLPGDGASQPIRAAFNLYVDSNYRPLAFVSSGGTVGYRVGYDFVTEAIPPIFHE